MSYNDYMKVFFALLILATALLVAIMFGRNSGEVDIPADDQTVDISDTTPFTPFPEVPDNEIKSTFEKLPHVQSVGSNLWHIEGTETDKNAGFGIFYNEMNNSYAIDVWKEPLGDTRERASRYFLSITKMSETEACAQNVYVGVVEDISPELTRKNLGLSFCPGAISI